jgi:hypothetical protein
MKVQSYKFVSLILLFVSIFFAASALHASEITIKAGTAVPVRLEEAVSSENVTAGQTIRFSVTRDVTVGDVVVIKSGSEVNAEIAHAQKTGTFGKEGKVSLVVRYAVAVDYTIVPLRANLSREGEEKLAVSFLFCPFIKGTSSMIPAGTEAKAYVEYDTKILVD